jgi:hypothetical protein
MKGGVEERSGYDANGRRKMELEERGFYNEGGKLIG